MTLFWPVTLLTCNLIDPTWTRPDPLVLPCLTTTHMVNVDDRLSNLPQDFLHYILSFLETRYIILLSRLSRRWRRVWKSMPYLNFVQTPFESKDRFIGFAWSMLCLRDGFDIKRYCLSCHGIRKHVLKPLLSEVKNRGVIVQVILEPQ